MPKNRGILISIEGVDTAGKSTQAQLLKSRLESEGREVVVMHFPRYEGVIGEYIGEILKDKEKFNSIDKRALQMLYAADQLNAQNEIQELLESGKIVILDRYDLSTIIYHCATNNTLLSESVSEVYHTLQANLEKPDISFILTLNHEEIAKRKNITDNMEEILNIKEITQNYISLGYYINDLRYFVYVDAEMPSMEVHNEMYSYLKHF